MIVTVTRLQRSWQEWEAEGLFALSAAASPPPIAESADRSLEQRLVGPRRAGPGRGGGGESWADRGREQAGARARQPPWPADRSSHYTHTKLETTTRAWTQTRRQGTRGKTETDNHTWASSEHLNYNNTCARNILSVKQSFIQKITEAVSDSNPYRLVESCLSMVTQWRRKHENNWKSWELGGDPLLSAPTMSLTSVGIYEFNAKDLIGHGAFAVVYKGRLKSVSEPFLY